MPEQDTTEKLEVEPTDIVFDCPHCGKSLAIDARGGGLTITCPGCRQKVQVPVPEGAPENAAAEIDQRDRRIGDLTAALEGAQAKIERLVEELEETRSRRKFLEELRVKNMDRFEAISGELGIIQSAIDRIIDKIQDVDISRKAGE